MIAVGKKKVDFRADRVSGPRHGLETVAANAFLGDLLALLAAVRKRHVEHPNGGVDMGADGSYLLLGILVDESPLLQVAVPAVLNETAQVVADRDVPEGRDIGARSPNRPPKSTRA